MVLDWEALRGPRRNGMRCLGIKVIITKFVKIRTIPLVVVRVGQEWCDLCDWDGNALRVLGMRF